MKQLKLTFILMLAFAMTMQAQNRRYFDEVFADVTVTTDVTYGVNATLIALSIVGQAIPQELKMNVYEPANDTETDRPLVIIMHSGNFLPPTVNGGCTGTIFDADNVALAEALAKRGYVVAVADYRLGWNPVASTQEERVFTLINAAYRGVQDSRTCVRYFRSNVAGGNTFGIDPEKITLCGFGTGGYISAASASLDTITDTYIPKFLTAAGPMVIEPAVGNVDGTSLGVAFQGYPHPVLGDTLCYPNHVGVSSDFALAVNLGGALGDKSWLDAGDIPIISFHAFNDPFAPCGTGIVNVPPPVNLPVVEVDGSCTFQPIVNSLGLNDVFVNANFQDDITAYASANNGGIEGFYPIYGDDSSPWAFASSAEPYGVSGSDCDVSSSVSDNFRDTILSYFLPRACALFGLNSDCALTTGLEKFTSIEVGMTASPNPATDAFVLKTDKRFVMNRVELVDMTGRVVRELNAVNSSTTTVETQGLDAGIYFARVYFKEGIATQKVVLH